MNSKKKIKIYEAIRDLLKAKEALGAMLYETLRMITKRGDYGDNLKISIEITPVNPGQVMQNVQPVRVLEKNAIRLALHESNGIKKDAAKSLGISERTLYRKMKEYNIVGK